MYKYLLFLTFFTSCGTTDVITEKSISSEEVNTSKQKESVQKSDTAFNVQFTVRQYIPYCGGAYPGEDQLNQYAVIHGGLLLINLETKEKSPLRANDEGLFQLMLPPGKYAIKEEFKDIPFEQFVQQHKKEGMYLIPGTDECYKKWWSGYLGEFEINENVPPLNFDYSLRNSCFTGNNPCDIYTGPYPP